MGGGKRKWRLSLGGGGPWFQRGGRRLKTLARRQFLACLALLGLPALAGPRGHPAHSISTSSVAYNGPESLSSINSVVSVVQDESGLG